MHELYIIIGSIIVAGIVHFTKTRTYIHPLWVVAGLSVLSGVGYAVLFKAGLWEATKEWAALVGAGAIAVYNIFKPIYEATTGKEVAKSLNSQK